MYGFAAGDKNARWQCHGYAPGVATRRATVNRLLDIGSRRRSLNEEKVRALAASIDEIGLQTPITVARLSSSEELSLETGLVDLTAGQSARRAWPSASCSRCS